MPLVAQSWGVERFEIDKGVNGPYVAALHLLFPSSDAMAEAMGSEATAVVMADVPNYTDIEPVLQTSEVVEG